MFGVSSDELTIYYCGREQCLSGYAFGPAVRPQYLIHLVLNGKGVYKRKEKTYALKEGDAFLISPMESTLYQADEAQPWEYAWVGFDGTQADKMLAQTCFRDGCVYNGDAQIFPFAHASSILFSLIRCFHSPDHNLLTLHGLFLQLLGSMAVPPENSRKDDAAQYLQLAQEYMKNNYGYNIKISDIAASIGIDRTYLYRIFMQEEHISPKQYLLRLRLRTAADMMRHPQYTITEIAFSCGFRDAAAFCSYFKKSTGYTPKDYRRFLKTERRYGGM